MQIIRSILLGLAALNVTAATVCPVADTSILANDGKSVGKIEKHNGIDMYITKPNHLSIHRKHKTAVLYLTDVFGIQLPQNRLLADSFARAGYLTIAPDFFTGNPAPEDLNTPGFDLEKFLDEHGPQVADPIIAKTIKFVREKLGIDKIAATGYCYGGKYSLRYLGKKDGADLGFAAHPALLDDDEVQAISKPASIAAAEHDEFMSVDRRHEIVAMLQKSGNPYQASLYSGTMHGFGTRANVSDPQQKFAKETAFIQAVRWFEAWSD